MSSTVDTLFAAIREELTRDERENPTPAGLLLRLLELRSKLRESYVKDHPDRVLEAAIETAVVAIRIALDGDADWNHIRKAAGAEDYPVRSRFDGHPPFDLPPGETGGAR